MRELLPVPLLVVLCTAAQASAAEPLTIDAFLRAVIARNPGVQGILAAYRVLAFDGSRAALSGAQGGVVFTEVDGASIAVTGSLPTNQPIASAVIRNDHLVLAGPTELSGLPSHTQ